MSVVEEKQIDESDNAFYRGLQLFGRNIHIFFFLYVVYSILSAPISAFLNSDRVTTSSLAPKIFFYIVITSVGVVLASIFKMFFLGACYYVKRKKPVNWGVVFYLVLSRLPKILVAYFIYYVLLIAGFICLIIPGFIVIARYSMVDPLIFFTDRSVRESFKLSGKLTESKLLEIFIALLAPVLLGVFPYMIGYSVSNNSTYQSFIALTCGFFSTSLIYAIIYEYFVGFYPEKEFEGLS